MSSVAASKGFLHVVINLQVAACYHLRTVDACCGFAQKQLNSPEYVIMLCSSKLLRTCCKLVTLAHCWAIHAIHLSDIRFQVNLGQPVASLDAVPSLVPKENLWG